MITTIITKVKTKPDCREIFQLGFWNKLRQLTNKYWILSIWDLKCLWIAWSFFDNSWCWYLWIYFVFIMSLYFSGLNPHIDVQDPQKKILGATDEFPVGMYHMSERVVESMLHNCNLFERFFCLLINLWIWSKKYIRTHSAGTEKLDNMNSNEAFENLLMNVEELKLIHLDGEMLLKLDVFLFILMDRLVSNRFTVLLQCEENTKWH